MIVKGMNQSRAKTINKTKKRKSMNEQSTKNQKKENPWYGWMMASTKTINQKHCNNKKQSAYIGIVWKMLCRCCNYLPWWSQVIVSMRSMKEMKRRKREDTDWSVTPFFGAEPLSTVFV